VLKVLRAVSEPPPNPDVSRDAFLIVGDNDEFVGEVSDQVEQSGFRSSIVLRRAEGEAKSLAAHFVETIEAQPAKVDAVIGGGEATVTVQGEGRGGRNTEFALAAAIELQDRGLDWVIASLAPTGRTVRSMRPARSSIVKPSKVDVIRVLTPNPISTTTIAAGISRSLASSSRRDPPAQMSTMSTLR